MNTSANPLARTLVVLGSFGRQQLEKLVTDWQQVVVLEVDGYLPEPLRSQCAGVMTIPPLLPAAEDAVLQKRTDDVLDTFLQDRVTLPGVLADRRFRAACMSIEAWRIVGPHLVSLEYARRLKDLAPWERIIVAPGAGVSLRAFQQLGQALGVPVQSLGSDREKPPFWWMLRRKWQRSRTRHQAQQSSAAPARLRPSSQPGECWCSDHRMEGMLARSEEADAWVRGPAFTELDPEKIREQQALYERWWAAWWQDWQRENAQLDPMADEWILEDLGRWFSRERYPRHALLLKQAQAAIQQGRPSRVLLGSMRGRQEFMWGLAAQDHGIPAAVYTIDCHVDGRLCFKPDLVLCDDMRQWQIATEKSGLPPERIVRVRSHRQLTIRDAKPGTVPNQRRRLLLADTYFSGIITSSSPLLSLWAIQRVIEAARELPEHDFIIKYHPVRERPDPTFHRSGLHHLHLWLRDDFIRRLSPTKNVSFLPPEVRLSDEMAKADMLLNIQSYAGLEAFALRMPVIYVQPWDEEGLYPSMNALGVMQVAMDSQRLVELIRRNFTDPGHASDHLAAQSRYLDYFYWQTAPSLASAALQTPIPSTQP